MTRIYTKQQLQEFNFFQLLILAEKLQVEYFEHFNQEEQIEAILDKQKEILNQK